MYSRRSLGSRLRIKRVKGGRRHVGNFPNIRKDLGGVDRGDPSSERKTDKREYTFNVVPRKLKILIGRKSIYGTEGKGRRYRQQSKRKTRGARTRREDV